MMKFLSRTSRLETFLGNIADKILRRMRPSENMSVNFEGFVMHRNGKIVANILWNEIEEIVAFKRDAIVVDLVCFEFRVKSGGVVYETNEDIRGFEDLVRELGKIFPTFDKDWRKKVLQPAFATNRTVIYKRQE